MPSILGTLRQDCVYNLDYDPFYKNQLKASKSIQETFQTSPIVDELNDVLEVLAIERADLQPPTLTAEERDEVEMEDFAQSSNARLLNLSAKEVAADLKSNGKISSFADYADRLVRQFTKCLLECDTAGALSDVSATISTVSCLVYCYQHLQAFHQHQA